MELNFKTYTGTKTIKAVPMEKTEAEKLLGKTASYILVPRIPSKNAYDNFIDGMRGTMADYEIEAITETKLVEVYKAKLSTDNG